MYTTWEQLGIFHGFWARSQWILFPIVPNCSQLFPIGKLNLTKNGYFSKLVISYNKALTF